MATDLWAMLHLLRQQKFVDLTHAFHPGIPHGAGFNDEMRETLFAHELGVGTKGDGFLVHQYTLVGQWGTHVDSPIHFVDGGRAVDEIDVIDMMLPLCVIDCTLSSASNPDYVLTIADIDAWEEEHGKLPKHAFVAMKTGWSARWPDAAQMRPIDSDGCPRFPGWSENVLSFLASHRDVVAIGHETTDTDPGMKAGRGDFAAEALWLAEDRYQIELLANLEAVPESGAIILATFPKVRGGSGFPARVFAICPNEKTQWLN